LTRQSASLPGRAGPINIDRDGAGIAHVSANDEWDAWTGMGFAAAEDRLWQMEYDRRRGSGRWAQVVGVEGVKADILARRLRLADAARADISVMSELTRKMFDSYVDGVNACIATRPAAPEFALAQVVPARWTVEDSIIAFKIRHILMGTWQLKLVQAIVTAGAGADALEAFAIRSPHGSLATIPPGVRVTDMLRGAEHDVADSARYLGFLSEAEAGSNAWVVSGLRTSTGMPVLCNDSHRALDVPNVYWQVSVEWPGARIAGAAFAGLPGLPHFGMNGRVAWAITHTMADYQDLYIERFDSALRHATPDGWQGSESRVERIEVRGSDPIDVETFRTRHGAVVHGDPRSGHALALRYTGTDGPCRTFNVFRTMLPAESVSDLFDAQADWVDPVNNLVAADTRGHIGYLTRGVLPIRSSRAHERLPSVGWTGDNEWLGFTPFEEMPRTLDPAGGVIVTSNQAVLAGDQPYIAHSFHDPFRAERIMELLQSAEKLTPLQIAEIQSDTGSWVAAKWVGYLRSLPRPADRGGQAHALLTSWDANLAPESAAALLYACFRRALARNVFEPIVGPSLWQWLTSSTIPAAGLLIRRGLASLIWHEIISDPPVERRVLRDVVPQSLSEAWHAAVSLAGPESGRWIWSDWHKTHAQHPLSRLYGSNLNPPTVGVGGDSDTPQTAAYGFREGSPFNIDTLSVYRQVVDLTDMERATSVVPGGTSGVPGDEHYADQLALWAAHQRVPMMRRRTHPIRQSLRGGDR
jgi:penicillin G amidase